MTNLSDRRYHPEWLTTVPIAHRGLHGDGRPENSLPAFEAAAAAGFAIELDVRLTADRRLVVIHEPDTGRMTGRKLRISDTSYAELTQMKLAGSEHTVPLFSDVLAMVAGRVPILIEVKTGSDPRLLGPVLCRILAGYGGEVAVASFDPRVVGWLRQHAPNIPRGQHAGSMPEKRTIPAGLRQLLRIMPLNYLTRPQFIVFDVRDFPDRALAWWAKQLGVPVVLWTIRVDNTLKQARAHGHNIIFEHITP